MKFFLIFKRSTQSDGSILAISHIDVSPGFVFILLPSPLPSLIPSAHSCWSPLSLQMAPFFFHVM